MLMLLKRNEHGTWFLPNNATQPRRFKYQDCRVKLKFVIYKVTFPNGKIYVGKDIGSQGHSINYFGSWNAELVEKDFTVDELRDFTIRKEILFESADQAEVSQREGDYIRQLNANNPAYGYNQRCPRGTTMGRST